MESNKCLKEDVKHEHYLKAWICMSKAFADDDDDHHFINFN